MILTDTHTHLYLEQFDDDIDAVLERCWESGVERLFVPNINAETFDAMMALVAKNPERIFPMVGLHPSYVKADVQTELDFVERQLATGKFCAVGEIGMDLYWDKTFVEQQKHALRTQVQWAKDRDLPIILHTREAFDEVFEIIDDLNDDSLKGIFHCFTGTVEQAQHIIEYGNFKLGIGGVLTYKKAALDEVLKDIPLHHMVLETDSPYLPPVPHRGKRNESSYVKLVAQKLADVKGIRLEEVAEVTTLGAREVFGF